MTSPFGRPPPVPEVGPAEAAAMANDGAVLLDVREDDEWAAGRAPSACHIALGRLAEEYLTLPAEGSIVAVCRSGSRSRSATAALRNAGYDVVNLAGGMKAWAAAGLPLVTDAGAGGSVI